MEKAKLQREEAIRKRREEREKYLQSKTSVLCGQNSLYRAFSCPQIYGINNIAATAADTILLPILPI